MRAAGPVEEGGLDAPSASIARSGVPAHAQWPEMPWSTPFDEPIPLRGGRQAEALQQAADYVMRLPEDVQQQERWQVAVENLIHAAEMAAAG